MIFIFSIIAVALGAAFMVGRLCAEDNDRRREDL